MNTYFSFFKIVFVLLLTSFGVFKAYSDTIVQELTQDNSLSFSTRENTDLTNEKIVRISETKRIFVITNESSSLNKGDFFSILLNEDLAARALVAKSVVEKNQVAIKILKIYSLKNWQFIRPNLSIQILKGDDSYYVKNKNSKTEIADIKGDLKINSEEDLYADDISLSDDTLLEENSNRAIKTDNIIGAGWGQFGVTDMDGGSVSFDHWGGSWSYQLSDNIWGEAFYGMSYLPDYPGGGVDTQINNITFRLKYCVKAPFDSFLMPYIGYQMISADSPGAGTEGAKDPDLEIRMVDELNETNIIFGVTVLRRLVPGWFLKADLGIDIVNLGLALEF